MFVNYNLDLLTIFALYKYSSTRVNSEMITSQLNYTAKVN